MASPVKTVEAGAKEILNPSGIGGMTGGVLVSPLARAFVYDAAPGVFREGDNADTYTLAFQAGQGILGAATAVGRMPWRSGIVRAVGAGVAVESARTILGRVFDV